MEYKKCVINYSKDIRWRSLCVSMSVSAPGSNLYYPQYATSNRHFSITSLSLVFIKTAPNSPQFIFKLNFPTIISSGFPTQPVLPNRDWKEYYFPREAPNYASLPLLAPLRPTINGRLTVSRLESPQRARQHASKRELSKERQQSSSRRSFIDIRW